MPRWTGLRWAVTGPTVVWIISHRRGRVHHDIWGWEKPRVALRHGIRDIRVLPGWRIRRPRRRVAGLRRRVANPGGRVAEVRRRVAETRGRVTRARRRR